MKQTKDPYQQYLNDNIRCTELTLKQAIESGNTQWATEQKYLLRGFTLADRAYNRFKHQQLTP